MVIVDRRAPSARLLDALDVAPSRGGAGAWLAPLGGLYALGASWRRRLRPAVALPPLPPSIGVGNLRVGGTGKTPVVAALAASLRARGLAPGVVTRGYGGEGGGDEPDWLGAQVDGLVVRDADRRRGFEEAARRGAQVVLLDDALQSGVLPSVVLAIALDRDRLLPPRPLPAGPAREGAAALRRAHALLVRVEQDPWPITPFQMWEYEQWASQTCGGRCFPFRLAPRELVAPDGAAHPLAQARSLGAVVLVTGLARPASFERDAQRAGLHVLGALRLADHVRPGSREAAAIARLAGALGAATVVCPEKNHARLAQLGLAQPLWRLRSIVTWGGDDPAAVLAPAWAPAT